jgi:hypothetical protein
VSRSLGCELPATLVMRLSGRDLESVAEDAIQIFTVDARGWPHPALLSYFEVVALDARHIRLATHGNSATTANMRPKGKLTIVLVVDGTIYYVKGEARQLAAAMQSAAWNAASECTVDDVLVDEVNQQHEPGAYVSSGVRYHNPRRSSELARARVVLRELLDLT